MQQTGTRKPAGSEGALAAWWESLEPIWRDKGLGPATKLAFAWLWVRAGNRPGRVVVTYYQLGAAFGRTHRAADKWIERLEKRGLVDAVDRDRITGVVTLYVNAPGELIRAAPIRDDQPSLPGMQDEPEAPCEQPDTIAIDGARPDGSDVSAQKRPDVSARKRPTPSGDGAPSRASSVRPSDRPTERWEIDWKEAQEFAVQLAGWIGVKPKTAFADAKLLLFAAALLQGRVPAIAVENALDAIKSQSPRNPAALFRVCLAEEIAKAMDTPLTTCREALSALERESRVPDQEVFALLAKLGGLKADSEDGPCKPLTESTAEERDEARQAIADARAALRKPKINPTDNGDPD